MVSKVRLADRVDPGPVVDVGEEDLHLDDVLGTTARSTQGAVEIAYSDLELLDNIIRCATIGSHPHSARQPDPIAGLDDVTIMTDGCRLVAQQEAFYLAHGSGTLWWELSAKLARWRR